MKTGRQIWRRKRLWKACETLSREWCEGKGWESKDEGNAAILGSISYILFLALNRVAGLNKTPMCATQPDGRSQYTNGDISSSSRLVLIKQY